MFLCAQKANGVVDQEITLHLVGEVTARHKFEARCRPHHMVFLDQLLRLVGEFAVARQHRAGQHPAHVGAGRFGEKRLPPIIKRDAPRVRNGQLSGAFQFVQLGAVPVKTAVCSPYRPIRRFHVGMQKHTFAAVNGPGWVGAKGVAVVMRIVVVITTEQNHTLVGLVVTIGIGK